MPLPRIDTEIKNTIYKAPQDGALVYKYAPFKNLKKDSNTDLYPLTISPNKANLDINGTINIDTESSYDNSVNLIINDSVNPLKIVNSRFYLDSSTTYKIADRKGNLDTNIYNEDTFNIDTNLVKIVDSIVTLDFLGIEDGGQMPVGNYNFYFKLSDSDGNESDFISESGPVVCHIGSVNNPKSIRGGQLNENSGKTITFRLNNLDLSYDYINIYYTRNSGTGEVEQSLSYKIVDKYKIISDSTTITITGYEAIEQIDNSDINVQYIIFDSAKTNVNCQNINFIGNTIKDYNVYSTLEKYSLLITPSLVISDSIGNIGHNYIERFADPEGYEYYNAKNIYYKLGYWDEEIYRFGIVYIMNDNSLSPVFNIRGIKTLSNSTTFKSFSISDNIEYDNNYNIKDSESTSNPENIKGIFKIDVNTGVATVFNNTSKIKPIGIKFTFNNDILTGDLMKPGLPELTKGCFIVRQKRIPTIITQGLSIATTNKTNTPVIFGTFTDENSKIENGYYAESFLTKVSGKPKLGRSFFEVGTNNIKQNALICPESSLKLNTYNSLFNSSEFILRRSKYKSNGVFADNSSDQNRNEFNLGNFTVESNPIVDINSKLLLIEPGISRISVDNKIFSSKVGEVIEPWQVGDPINGPIDEVIETDEEESDDKDLELSMAVSKIRGIYNTYLGTNVENLNQHQIYNIFQKDYNFNDKWRDYFKVRYNNASPYMAVSDKMSWDSITTETPAIYRGDCYINTYSHRMNWNFIDPELPTNTTIMDPWTWFKNYRIKTCYISTDGLNISEDTKKSGNSAISYKKLLELYTLSDEDISKAEIILADAKKFEKYSEENGLFGSSKLNRPDINAVPQGHWVTFKICSNINLAMRDIDFSRAAEESLHKEKRSFYPLQNANPENKLPESNVINLNISKPLGNKYYLEYPDVPFIKNVFNTRIYYSNILQESVFKNGNRVFQAKNYKDYTNEYGSLVKLIEWYGRLIAVMEHGILMIPVNERALMKNESGENIYVNTENVLPSNPKVISGVFGSLWADSVVKTTKFIYGIDTVGKKIWRTNGEIFELISDLRIQKFLNDHINLSTSEAVYNDTNYSIKAHYNAFKQDILFVYKVGSEQWNLCWNELRNIWYTRYTWFPSFSENINNIFYTFANNDAHQNKGNILYKHGFAGAFEENVDILPTKWYDEQQPFEFEFVVIGIQGVQKIFDNLKIISNKTSPESFYYEIVGEGFSWNAQKDDMYAFTQDLQFQNYLTTNLGIKKIPYIKAQSNFVRDRSQETLVRDCTLIENNKTKEKLINIYQKGLDIKTTGRLKGNMQYVEDSWDIQIQPIIFKYAYIDSSGALLLSNSTEMKLRDKYIKIRVRYDGTKYAIINSLKTMFTISYA